MVVLRSLEKQLLNTRDQTSGQTFIFCVEIVLDLAFNRKKESINEARELKQVESGLQFRLNCFFELNFCFGKCGGAHVQY